MALSANKSISPKLLTSGSFCQANFIHRRVSGNLASNSAMNDAKAKLEKQPQKPWIPIPYQMPIKKKTQIILCQIIYGWQQIFLIISIHSHSQWILCKEIAKKTILPSRFLARTAEVVAVFAEWLYKSGTEVPLSCPSSKFLKVCIHGRKLG